MINDADVRAKDDSELLEIWANQSDYRSEVVDWVRVEIERRHLDISHVPIPTAEELRQDREVSSLLLNVRVLAFGQGAFGLLLLIAAFWITQEHFFGDPVYQSGRPGLTAALIVLGVGSLLIVYAVGVWSRKKWAFVSGFFIYALITLLNVATMALNGFNLYDIVYHPHRLRFFGGSERDAIAALLFSALGAAVSAGLASWFNTLRKSGTVAPRAG